MSKRGPHTPEQIEVIKRQERELRNLNTSLSAQRSVNHEVRKERDDWKERFESLHQNYEALTNDYEDLCGAYDAIKVADSAPKAARETVDLFAEFIERLQNLPDYVADWTYWIDDIDEVISDVLGPVT